MLSTDFVDKSFVHCRPCCQPVDSLAWQAGKASPMSSEKTSSTLDIVSASEPQTPAPATAMTRAMAAAPSDLFDPETPSGDRQNIAQIAIPSPLHRVFDYRWPDESPIVAGLRVKVPFGRRTVVGIVVASASSTEVPAGKLKRVTRVLDAEPLIPADLFKLLEWASAYYHHPLGEVMSGALPVALRKGAAAELQRIEMYCVGPACPGDIANSRAPVQAALMMAIQESGAGGIEATRLASVSRGWRASMKPLLAKGWVERRDVEDLPLNTSVEKGQELLPEQQKALDAVAAGFGSFNCHLLNGVTGSGKTEVYLQLIERLGKQGLQSLVLVPEISLTPQLLNRFSRRLSGCIVTLHSALSDNERMQNWLLASTGKADVVIGTRSAIFTALPRLGMIVIDEEHDGSLKQQDGFRYHARDLAMMRARERSVPVLLGTATPSFESLNNVRNGRYQQLRLTRRAGDAQAPEIALLDIRRRALTEGLSDRLLDHIKAHLDDDGQILIFINRRGFAPTLLCNDCGACADCQRCDSHMTVHERLNRLRCHHCGAERPIPLGCESCGSERLDRVGHGTERIEKVLQEQFPEIMVARIDRDSTRRKGALQQYLQDATSGRARILVGTQMLAKGHHFPGVTLVGILDADRGLFGTDFRALEQMGQLILQVAGRAGREKRRGTVLVQTRNPDNHLLQTLVLGGYDEFAATALADRESAGLPPFSYVALVRAEAAQREAPHEFLSRVAHVLRMHHRTVADKDLAWFGPVPAPMERLGGRFRAQLMVQSSHRAVLNHALRVVVANFENAAESRKTRWSIDVDPVDFF